MTNQPDVQIYCHKGGFSVYYLTHAAHAFLAKLRKSRTVETWPAIDELIALLKAQNIAIDYTRAIDVTVH